VERLIKSTGLGPLGVAQKHIQGTKLKMVGGVEYKKGGLLKLQRIWGLPDLKKSKRNGNRDERRTEKRGGGAGGL